MTKLSIPDMSCGHCKAAVTKAITETSPGAKVEVDLTSRTVETDAPDMAAVLAALATEGYPATPA